MPNKVEDKVVPESQCETCTDPKESIINFWLTVNETKCELVENKPEPTKFLSQEVKKIEPVYDVSIIPTPKVLNQIETVPIKNLIAFYDFKFDKVSLVRKQPR